MAKRKRERERRRQVRIAEQQAGEERGKRRKRRLYVGLAAGLVALAVVTIVIVSTNNASAPALAPAVTRASTAPALRSPTLASGTTAASVLETNTRQANHVLDTSIQAKLAQLPGVPVVVNQWASWCPNCKFEFPFFQRLGRADAGRIAFVGLDSQDSQANAQAFLSQHPVDYPSVFDATASQAQSLGAGQGWPTTIYFNAKHQITSVHVGAYQTLQALEQDIARYT